MAEKLTLEQLRVAVGLEAHDLARRAGVSTQFIREAEDKRGNPVARVKMQKVCDILSKEHGRLIRMEDIKELNLC